MAVQDTDKPTLCERCFATLKPGADYCPECGAPVEAGPATEGSDAAIYPELARANLLRMRGDYKAAAEQCRAILRRFPNNASANILLGDISAEQGDLEQAREWYELALDLMPDSVATQQKLANVRLRIEQAANRSVADQIGLPPQRQKPVWPIVGVFLGVLAVGAIAYVVGLKVQERQDKSPSVGAPIQAPEETGRIDTKGATEPANDGASPPTTGGATTPGGPQEDQSLAQLISQRGPDGAHVISVQQDPRAGLLTLTYRVAEGESERAIGASLARTAFEQSASTQVVTLRAVRNNQIVYVADARRDGYAETESPEWKQQNANDPNAWINRILSQEWTPTGSAPPDTPTSNQSTTGGPDSDDPNPPGGTTQGSTTTGG